MAEDHPGRAQADGMQAAVQLTLPEIHEFVKEREFRGAVVILPEEGLQQGRIIGEIVKDFRRGQQTIVQLVDQTCHDRPAVFIL